MLGFLAIWLLLIALALGAGLQQILWWIVIPTIPLVLTMLVISVILGVIEDHRMAKRRGVKRTPLPPDEKRYRTLMLAGILSAGAYLLVTIVVHHGS